METIWTVIFWDLKHAVSLVERSNIQCPFLGVSFIRGSTVF